MVKKNILKPKKIKKTLKPIQHTGANAPLQFQVQKDLNVAKKVMPKKVFENYKENIKKVVK